MVNQLGVPTVFLYHKRRWYPPVWLISAPWSWNHTAWSERTSSIPDSTATCEQKSIRGGKRLSHSCWIYIKNVLIPRLSIKHHWIRYERQHRGSGQVPFILWRKKPPMFLIWTTNHPKIFKGFATILVSSFRLRALVRIDHHHLCQSAWEMYQKTVESKIILRYWIERKGTRVVPQTIVCDGYMEEVSHPAD